MNRVATIDSSKCEMLLRSIASAILALVDGINDIVGERTVGKESYLDAAPDVLPHQLVQVLPRNYCSYLQRLRERLEQTFSAEEIEKIKRQYKTLCGSYRQQPNVKSCIDSFNDASSYHDAWIGHHDKYKLLQRFTGGLATIFPGTSTVESDFSVAKFEKTKNRMNLTDVSLEGILHAKQYRRLRSLNISNSTQYTVK